MLEPLKSLFLVRRQEKLARTVCLEALDQFRRIHALAPELSGEPLYERVISTRFGVDHELAHQMVRRARESYADWPVSRDVRFRDVVHYFIADRCLKGQAPTEDHWIRGKIELVVRSVIPRNL